MVMEEMMLKQSVQALLPRENREDSQSRQDSKNDYPEESPRLRKK